MKPTIIIRVDGGTTIGMGHVIRCHALAEMLRHKFSIVFAIQNNTGSISESMNELADRIITLPVTDDYAEEAGRFAGYLGKDDIVVLDGYHFKTDYQKAVIAIGCKLVCIDDLHAWHQVADVVINYVDGIEKSVYASESYTEFYLGLEYVLLRKPFLNATPVTKKINSIKKVFVSMGASDINNLTQRFTEALMKVNGVEEIDLMLGSINPNIQSIEKLILNNKHIRITTHFNISAEDLILLLKKCDVAMCPASTISLECCAIGTGLISGYTADNQLENLNGLIKRKTLISFGDLNALTVDDIKNKFEQLILEPQQVNELIHHQKQLIDGKSPGRILESFLKLINN